MSESELLKAVERHIPLAENLFRKLREKTMDAVGITRISYGEGEQAAHELMAETARSIDLFLMGETSLPHSLPEHG